MTQAKRFELSVLVSFLNGYSICLTSDEAKKELVEHVYGRELEHHEYKELMHGAKAYLLDKYETIKKAADLVSKNIPDRARYNKLIDLYGMWHFIVPMESVA